MIRAFIVLTILVLGGVVNSQSKIEEKKAQLKIEEDPYQRGKLFMELAQAYERNNVELAQKYLDSTRMMKEYATEGRAPNLIAFRQSRIYETASKYDEALAILDSLLLLESVQQDTLLLGDVYFRTGNIFLRKKEWNRSMEALNKAKNIYLTQDEEAVATANVSLGIVMKNLGRYDEAIPLYESAKEVFIQNKNYDGAASCILNIANIVSREGDHDKAIIMYEEALEIADKLDNDAGLLSFVYNNMSNAYNQKEDYRNALRFGLLNLPIVEKIGSPVQIATTCTGLGQNYSKLGDTSNGIKYYQRALEIAKENELIEVENRAAEGLLNFYIESGNSGQAYNALKIYKSTRDTLQARAIDKNVVEVNTRYETERKENEIALLNKENDLKALQLSARKKQMWGLGVALLLFGFLLYRLYGLNGKLKKALNEKNILLQEIHHRVKNNLQVISSLLGLQSRYVHDEGVLDAIKSGRGRVQSMSLLHQNLYREENLKGVRMKDYFTNLTQNLFDTYNIDEDNITFSTDIDDLELDIDTVVPLGLIANELITNALKHAFKEGEAGNIHVALKEFGNRLHLTVSDNGKGLPEGVLPISGGSLGSKLINSFAEKLDAEVVVDSSQGTSVTIDAKTYKKAS
jgi:two-component sensor histidine kinase/predicted negative regulator of RcsB-dependent stress response